VRAVGLHPDVVVVTSRVYQTTCTLVRSGDSQAAGAEAFAIDSPVLPDELDLLPAIAGQAGFPVVGCLATHGDWDHLLGRYAFPDAPLGIAEATAARLRNEPGAAQRELRAFDEEHYVERPGPLSLGRPEVMQTLPVPGHCGIGERELELHLADGHTEDGMAVWIPWAAVLVCGDYLSPVEIPWLSEHGSARAYLATLRRLAPLVEQADHVVPGHGAVLDGARAGAILGEDVAYLEALLERGAAAPLPLARRGGAQRRIHAENAARVA
jgi:glyoxylase-like metal-dependent hydrolase (beta-lactamase superfamily II)